MVAPIPRRRLWMAWLAVMWLVAACLAVGWMVVRLGLRDAVGTWSESLLVVVGVVSIASGVMVMATLLGRAYTTIDEGGIRQLTVRGWQSMRWGDIEAVDMERRAGVEIVVVRAEGRIMRIDTQYFERERLLTCLNAREMKWEGTWR